MSATNARMTEAASCGTVRSKLQTSRDYIQQARSFESAKEYSMAYHAYQQALATLPQEQAGIDVTRQRILERMEMMQELQRAHEQALAIQQLQLPCVLDDVSDLSPTQIRRLIKSSHSHKTGVAAHRRIRPRPHLPLQTPPRITQRSSSQTSPNKENVTIQEKVFPALVTPRTSAPRKLPHSPSAPHLVSLFQPPTRPSSQSGKRSPQPASVSLPTRPLGVRQQPKHTPPRKPVVPRSPAQVQGMPALAKR